MEGKGIAIHSCPIREAHFPFIRATLILDNRNKARTGPPNSRSSIVGIRGARGVSYVRGGISKYPAATGSFEVGPVGHMDLWHSDPGGPYMGRSEAWGFAKFRPVGPTVPPGVAGCGASLSAPDIRERGFRLEGHPRENRPPRSPESAHPPRPGQAFYRPGHS